MKKVVMFAVVSAAALTGAVGTAQAQSFYETGGGGSFSFGDWNVDRYAPGIWMPNAVDPIGGRALLLGLLNSDRQLFRPGGFQFDFYNTQGRQRTTVAPQGWQVGGELYIPASWTTPGSLRRSDLWTRDAAVLENDATYPIVGFVNNDPSDPFNPLAAGFQPRFRVYNSALGDWDNLPSVAPLLNQYNSVRIVDTGSSYDIYINGNIEHSLSGSAYSLAGSEGLSTTFVEGYNFGVNGLNGSADNGASLPSSSYDIFWKNVFANAGAPATLTIDAADSCVNAAEGTITVGIDLSNATDLVVGGQFFLSYDNTALDFVSISAGDAPFTLPVFQSVNEALGTIDCAVGVPGGGPGTAADTTMVHVTFAVLSNQCDVADLVRFRAHVPPTRVTNNTGVPQLPLALEDLASITLDTTAPTLAVTSGLTASDSCSAAPTLPGPGTFQFSTLGATFDGGGTCGSSGASPDVWYMYVPTANGSLSVQTCGLAGYDTVLEALSVCGGPTVQCNDDSCALQSALTLSVRAWVPVMIRMSGFSGASGSGFIAVAFTPSSPIGAAVDNCGAALPNGEGLYTFDTTTATVDGAPASCAFGGQNSSADQWIRYTPTATGTATVQACGLTSLDTILEAFTGCGGTLILCNDDSCSLQSSLTFPVTAGVPVTVRVSGWDADTGAGSVRISLSSPFSLNRVVKADAGLCTAAVTYSGTSTDNCDASPSVVFVPPSGSAFPIGTTLVTATATDDCGNQTNQVFSVTVLGVNELVADVQLANVSVAGPLSRCITFNLNRPALCPGFIQTENTLTFASGLSHSVIDVPCGFYNCITARDRLHTLRRTDDDSDFQIVGTRYRSNFTSTGATNDALLGGNFNDDEFIEILDFGIFVGQFALPIGGANTSCATPGPHADASGDGIVGAADFTFIQTQFLFQREMDCCGNLSIGEPRDPIADISTDELAKMGQGDLVIADLNRDGRLNADDVVAFMNGSRPCPADFNRDAFVDSRDFFAFINAFFSGDADFNHDSASNSADLFDFLTSFFGGC